MLQRIAYLILFFLLGLSCNNQEVPGAKADRPDKIDPTLKAKGPENLKYISGIRSILHDSKGNYWLGSQREGVCLYDGNSFNYFTVADGLSDNQVRRIKEDKNGNIWFGTGDGVSSFNSKQIIDHTANKGVTPIAAIPFLQEGTWQLKPGDIWFNAERQAGVYRYDGQALNYLKFPVPEDDKAPRFFGVTDFSRGKNNQIWIATYGAVYGYDGETWEIINDASLGYSQETGRLHVRFILEDSKGRLWIGNNGIGVLLREKEEVINFSDHQGLLHAASTRNGKKSPAGTLEHVFAIEEDKYGNIWFGDRDTGAWKYDGTSMTNYSIDSTLESQMIWDIYQDGQGELLFAMAHGEVYSFDGKAFRKKF